MNANKPLRLLLGIHNHQPVGNFGDVFAKAFKCCYWPLVRMLEKYPDVKLALHHSGPLLDWAMDNEPAYIPTIAGLVERGQVEILGGGYYEPILTVLKPSDALGQIEMMQDFWRRATGRTPRGMWLAERVWEPSLAGIIADAGLAYTILDDEHFRYAGMLDDTLFNYYRTERAGRSIAVFPTDKTMRYLIPFKQVEDVIAHLKQLSEQRPGAAITYGDDGEKFGMWPGTFEWVIKKGWLEKFFQALTEHRHEFETMHFSDFMSDRPPEGNVYLPTASYNEMLEWAMPAESIGRYEETRKRLEDAKLMDLARPFLRGGLWDNFLSKYPESNAMHKKCIYISDRLDELERKTKLSDARRALFRAQCNCAYWHGLFGGLYLNYLRHAVYANLIDAENLIDESIHGDAPFINAKKIDIDGDGIPEVVMATDRLIATVSPACGASLTELSWRPSKLNLGNTLARRFEAYHRKADGSHAGDNGGLPSIHDIEKDIGDSMEDLTYDRFPRHSFMEHLYAPDTDAQQTSAAPSSFADRCFDAADPESNTGFARTTLEATAPHPVQGNTNVRMKKSYRLERCSLAVAYELEADDPAPFLLGIELNMTLLAGHDPQRYYQWGDEPAGKVLMDAKKSLQNLDSLNLVDEAFGLRVRIDAPEASSWRFEPVETISQSESGFDRCYQGSNIWIYKKLQLGKGEKAHFSVSLSFEGI